MSSQMDSAEGPQRPSGTIASAEFAATLEGRWGRDGGERLESGEALKLVGLLHDYGNLMQVTASAVSLLERAPAL